MNFLDKLNEYNQKISYNIFALNGYIVFFIFVYWNFLVEPDYSYVLHLFIFNAFIISIFLIAFIVWLFELVFNFKINNHIFSNNKIIKIIRYIGVAISLIYLVYNVTALVYTLFIESFFPSDLIYFDIHSK